MLRSSVQLESMGKSLVCSCSGMGGKVPATTVLPIASGGKDVDFRRQRCRFQDDVLTKIF